MGFMQGLGRFMKGEPIFQASSSSTAHQTPQNNSVSHDSHQATQQSPGQKVIPKVEVEETDVHVNGHHLRVVVRIKNHSGGRIELDKIRLLNTKRELDTWLAPHQEKEFIVYEGSLLTHRNYDDAWIDYKDASGDYFQQYHTVTFRQESPTEYSVEYIRPAGPVKDI